MRLSQRQARVLRSCRGEARTTGSKEVHRWHCLEPSTNTSQEKVENVGSDSRTHFFISSVLLRTLCAHFLFHEILGFPRHSTGRVIPLTQVLLICNVVSGHDLHGLYN